MRSWGLRGPQGDVCRSARLPSGEAHIPASLHGRERSSSGFLSATALQTLDNNELEHRVGKRGGLETHPALEPRDL